jgi:hypothetical protein
LYSSNLAFFTSNFADLRLGNYSVSDSEFTVISKPNQSEADTSSAVEVASASDGSQFELISTVDASETDENHLDAPSKVGSLSVRASSPGLDTEAASPTRPLTLQNLTWKAVEDVARGSVQTYANMMIADIKAGGVNFRPGDGFPAKGELIGDQLPGYADMNLGAQIWSWLTRKQRAVIDGQILKEIKHHDKDQE